MLTKNEIYHSIMTNDSNVTCIKYEPNFRTNLCSHWDSNQGNFCSKCSIDKWHVKTITQVMEALDIWFINIKLEIDIDTKSGDNCNVNEEHNIQDIKWREKEQARSYTNINHHGGRNFRKYFELDLYWEGLVLSSLCRSAFGLRR